MQLVPNLVIADRFRLQRLLGKGGMGSVWEALHLGLDIPCAVKFIEGETVNDPEARMRFEREAKAAAQLRSPHVVQIFDHGIHEGIPYIAMELLVGEDVRHRLDKITRIDAPDLIRIVEQVSRALTRAHGAGIIHRDLKPENVYLVRDDDREIAKVLDFGIAKKQDAFGPEASQTRTGRVLGSPYYMSPEQANGAKIDSRSDLWSLAVIVYECITGMRPFESEGLAELMVKIFAAPLPVPSRTASVPRGFDAWWARAATRDPAGRFQTAKELSDALALAVGVTAAGHATLGVPTPEPPAEMRSAPSAPPPALAVTPPVAVGAQPQVPAAVALAPSVAHGAIPAQTTSAPLSTSQAGLPAPSGRKWVLPVAGAGAALLVMLAAGGVAVTALRGRTRTPASAPSAEPIPVVVAPPSAPAPLAALDPSSLPPPADPGAAVAPSASEPAPTPAPSSEPAASTAPVASAPVVTPVLRPAPTPASSVAFGTAPPTASARRTNPKPASSATLSHKIGF